MNPTHPQRPPQPLEFEDLLFWLELLLAVRAGRRVWREVVGVGMVVAL